jgi:hypothetical protein
MSDFKAMAEKEAERLTAAIRDAEKRRAVIDDEIAGYQREKKALVAYQNTLTGTKSKAASGKRGSRQDGIVAVLKGNATGLSRGDILDKLGLKGNKTGEQSISNALNNMKKAGKVTAQDGKYILVS